MAIWLDNSEWMCYQTPPISSGPPRFRSEKTDRMRLSFLFVVSVVLVVGACAQSSPTPSPRFAINLDLPADQRWNQVTKHFQSDFAPVFAWIDKIVPEWLQAIVVPLFADVDKYMPEPYASEMRGLAAASGYPLGKIVFMNLVYDLSAFCTSIVTQTANGTILHSRNLDYPISGLRNLTMDLDFQSNNQTQYSCTTFAGYVGCLTGMRPNGFSVSVDERDVKGLSPIGNIIAGLEGGHSLGFTIRDALATNTSFSGAVEFLSQVHLMAPVYIIVGGLSGSEGAVLTRNRSHAIDVWVIDDNIDRWYVLETNYDHWKPAPTRDDRRDAAMKVMNAIGKASMDQDGLFRVLSTPPVLNSGTKYTCEMAAATGHYQSYVRFDAGPTSQGYSYRTESRLAKQLVDALMRISAEQDKHY